MLCWKKEQSWLDDTNELCSVHIIFDPQDKAKVKDVYDGLGDSRAIQVEWDQSAHPTLEWRDRIRMNIENYDTILFFVSPASIVNQQCMFEIDHSIKSGKRIILVMIDHIDWNEAKQRVKDFQSFQCVFFYDTSKPGSKDDGDLFDRQMNALNQRLKTDQKHAAVHTRLLKRAIDWEKHDFEKSMLLRGADLKRAKNWISASALGKEPKPTTLHLSYVTASDALKQYMDKRQLIAVFFFFIVIIGIAWPSWGVFFFSLVFSHFFVYFSSN
jgi:hypothetical protein